jgi:long-chain acyl-CoA synthetase
MRSVAQRRDQTMVDDDGTALSPTIEELDQLCVDHIARYKRPKDYRFVESLPTNNYGKVVKRELREQLDHEV